MPPLLVFEDFAYLFERLAKDTIGRSFIKSSFLYVYWTTDLTKQQIITFFHKISRQTGEIVPTISAALELPLATVTGIINRTQSKPE